MSEPPSLSAAADAVINALEESILQRFPDATFEVRAAMDARLHLTVYADTSNDFDIQDLVAEQTVDAMIRGDAKIHVMPRPASQLLRD